MSTVIKAGRGGPILQRLSTVDLADHLAEAEAVIAEAKRRAAQIVVTAERDAERMREAARQAGHREGLDQGRKAGTELGREAAWEAATAKFEAEQAGVVAAMEKAIVDIDSIKGDVVIQAEQHVLDFAIRMATRLTYAIGRLDGESAKANLGRSLRLVDSKTNLVVHVHPDDLSAMEAFAVTVLQEAEGSRSLKIVADAATAPGGCRVEYGGFEIDATLDTQIEEIVTLLTGRPQNE